MDGLPIASSKLALRSSSDPIALIALTVQKQFTSFCRLGTCTLAHRKTGILESDLDLSGCSHASTEGMQFLQTCVLHPVALEGFEQLLECRLSI